MWKVQYKTVDAEYIAKLKKLQSKVEDKPEVKHKIFLESIKMDEGVLGRDIYNNNPELDFGICLH